MSHETLQMLEQDPCIFTVLSMLKFLSVSLGGVLMETHMIFHMCVNRVPHVLARSSLWLPRVLMGWTPIQCGSFLFFFKPTQVQAQM